MSHATSMFQLVGVVALKLPAFFLMRESCGASCGYKGKMCLLVVVKPDFGQGSLPKLRQEMHERLRERERDQEGEGERERESDRGTDRQADRTAARQVDARKPAADLCFAWTPKVIRLTTEKLQAVQTYFRKVGFSHSAKLSATFQDPVPCLCTQKYMKHFSMGSVTYC